MLANALRWVRIAGRAAATHARLAAEPKMYGVSLDAIVKVIVLGNGLRGAYGRGGLGYLRLSPIMGCNR